MRNTVNINVNYVIEQVCVMVAFFDVYSEFAIFESRPGHQLS